MATSGVTDFALTAREIMRQAAVELGAISSGEDLEASEQDDMLVRLNSMLKSWGTEGNLYREASGTVTVPGGTGAGTLPAGVRDIISVRHVVSPTNYRQLTQWNRSQYYQMPNRSAAGNPTAFYATQGLSQDAIYIWPVPAADVDLHLDYYRAPEVVTNAAETLDVPQDWTEAVILGIAARCANMFGATRLDPATVANVTARAAALYQMLLDQDRPDSYFFEAWDG